ncbi:S1-like domain-containing RNA-binding protein [Methylomarinum sp. Ch1-1]|uniref:S1-like domain-containing RNA-binding protein n=1 Tax=Methylomarinum roseum TaxID=3067653 RepID=A0AAU7NSA0_9GAMM|nr:S1-like domain-containing RNA-binding protein [Methylomarinum sp. Ch1-1]MDP4520142.1 S1-like domain-containing RNA-binding protein [Methylomarinum sp. Ch1-1]
MINIGKFNTLKICKRGDRHLYLDGGESGEIPLKLNETKGQHRVGDELRVFVYTDGKGDLLATTQKPLAQVDEVAWLKVVSLSHAGAFLDWGLPKDLLVPFSEQKYKMVEGRHYLVKLFLDEQNRIAASTLLDDFIRDQAVYLKEGQKVDLVIADETDLGIKAVVNNQFWGVLYKNEVFQKLKKGQKMTGFIKKIRDDGKLDLSLDQDKYQDKVDLARQSILAYLQQHGGEMNIGEKSPPEVIYARFAVSKKVFKQAVGGLYKQRLITLDDHGIKLTDKA